MKKIADIVAFLFIVNFVFIGGAVFSTVHIVLSQANPAPPERSNGGPHGQIPAGWTEIMVGLQTDKQSVCRYSRSPNIPYFSMAHTFQTTGSVGHSTPITGLKNGDSVSVFVRCRASDGGENNDDYVISFAVSTATVAPPVRTGGMPAGTLSAGVTQSQLSLSTDRAAVCRYTSAPGTMFYAMLNAFGSSNGINHTAQIAGLQAGTHNFYVRCKATNDGAENIDDYIISFTIPSGGLPTGTVQTNGSPDAQTGTQTNTQTGTQTSAPTDPMRSNFSPANAPTLPAGTRQIQAGLITDVPSLCKYSFTANTDFDHSAAAPFITEQNNTVHTAAITQAFSSSNVASPLSDGETYSLYVRCRNLQTNATNTDDRIITFTIAAAEPQPEVPADTTTNQNTNTSGAPMPPGRHERLPILDYEFIAPVSVITFGLRTDTGSECRYSAASAEYASMSETFLRDYSGKVHRKNLFSLPPGVYEFFVRCKNLTNAAVNTDDFIIRFKVISSSVTNTNTNINVNINQNINRNTNGNANTNQNSNTNTAAGNANRNISTDDVRTNANTTITNVNTVGTVNTNTQSTANANLSPAQPVSPSNTNVSSSPSVAQQPTTQQPTTLQVETQNRKVEPTIVSSADTTAYKPILYPDQTPPPTTSAPPQPRYLGPQRTPQPAVVDAFWSQLDPALANRYRTYCNRYSVLDLNQCKELIARELRPECRRENILDPTRCEEIIKQRSLDAYCSAKNLGSGTECVQSLLEQKREELFCGSLIREECMSITENQMIGQIARGLQQSEDMAQTIQNQSDRITVETLRSIALQHEYDETVVPIKPTTDKSLLLLSLADAPIDVSTAISPSVSIPYVILLDADQDGLPDDLEQRYGTDPSRSDTDGDGFSDLEELRSGYDPLSAESKLAETPPVGVDLALINHKSIDQPITKGQVDLGFTLQLERSMDGSIYTLKGTADPDTVILIYLYSPMPLVLTSKTDKFGNWTYTLSDPITDSKHVLYTALADDNGIILRKSTPFAFFVRRAQAVSAQEFLAGERITAEEATYTPMKQYYILFTISLVATGLLIGSLIFLIKRHTYAR